MLNVALSVFVSPTQCRESMARTYRLEYPDGTEEMLEEIERDDWESLRDPCPECGGTEFVQYSARGGQKGVHDGAVILRTDYEGATTPLLTECLSCRETLHKHPLVDMLDRIPLGE